jgi:hypothetical protein
MVTLSEGCWTVHLRANGTVICTSEFKRRQDWQVCVWSDQSPMSFTQLPLYVQRMVLRIRGMVTL